MDFDCINGLLLPEEKLFSEWPHFGDVLGETDLKPLPESLARLDDTMGFSPPSLFCDTCSATVPCRCNACSESLERMELDDIDLDSFAWSCNLSSDAVDVRLPLPASDLPFGAFEAGGEGGDDVPGASTWDGRKTSEKRGCGRASRLNGLGFLEIKNYFDMPITKAAKAMNVGLTVLKKRCRELGIARWPHRKMKSLKSLIRNVQVMGKGSFEEAARKELETLEEHRRLMEENPQIQLTERTKKLRQACFKANYKKRRLLHHRPCLF